MSQDCFRSVLTNDSAWLQGRFRGDLAYFKVCSGSVLGEIRAGFRCVTSLFWQKVRPSFRNVSGMFYNRFGLVSGMFLECFRYIVNSGKLVFGGIFKVCILVLNGIILKMNICCGYSNISEKLV